jgi:hypothetical protein
MEGNVILDRVERYYTGRFAEHGATPRGVDWNSPESQELRFEQLLKVCSSEKGPFSLNDYGCGYAALVPYIERQGLQTRYRGFDLSAPMLEHARREYERPPRVSFVNSDDELERADYTIASGIFNVKLETPAGEWEGYVFRILARLAELSTKGFAFNMLTSYSDAEKMRPDLYYGDPLNFFDVCKQRYSQHVALLHDYGLWEFTIVVRNL